jgi:PilZ domain-containing protein
MTTATDTSTKRDHRTWVRVPFAVELAYRAGAAQARPAECLNLSRGGLCLRMSRYLRPGRQLLVTVGPESTEPTELKAEVAWVLPMDRGETFEVGLRVIPDEPETEDVMTRLVHTAVTQAEAVRPRRTETRSTECNPLPQAVYTLAS